MITTIPFNGFYNTWHDDLLDRAVDSLIQTSNGDPIEGLHEHAYFAVDWTRAYIEYATAYAEAWLGLHGIKGTFDELRSPREYNFETDRIFVDVPDDEVLRISALTPSSVLAEVAKERFTSRSGFMSFYSPDVEDWGDIEEWDHNQVGSLLIAYSRYLDVMPECEADLMETLVCNGDLDNWVCNTPKVVRIANIADYLRRREERAYRFTSA